MRRSIASFEDSTTSDVSFWWVNGKKVPRGCRWSWLRVCTPFRWCRSRAPGILCPDTANFLWLSIICQESYRRSGTRSALGCCSSPIVPRRFYFFFRPEIRLLHLDRPNNRTARSLPETRRKYRVQATAQQRHKCRSQTYQIL
jgi:hypothetical protein